MRLHDFLDFHANAHPEAEFSASNGRRVTYGEAQAAVNRLANAFISHGLEQGDRVAVLGKNSLEYVLIYLGASKAGVVPVPLNYRLAPHEWAWIVSDSRARLLLATDTFVAPVDAIRQHMPQTERFIAVDAPTSVPRGWDDFRAWVADEPAAPPDRHVSPDHDLFQMYTSGTTGRPKGAILTQRAITINVVQHAATMPVPPRMRYLIVAPLYHCAATWSAASALYWGGSLLIHEDFVPAKVIQALSEEAVGWVLLVPSMIQACLAGVPDAGERCYSDLKYILYGASPIAEQTLRRAIAAFRCGFVHVYGMTETGPAITLMPPEEHQRGLTTHPELLLSAGRPLMGTEVRIVDAMNNPVAVGEMGEIVVRGPQLMRGYWNQPEATEEALRGGWMHTGDAGSMDADGYVSIQDRVKDMIISGGENIYPSSVESVLFAHPAVADVAVIGVPDDQWGEAVKAMVVLRAGQVATEAELIQHCRNQLGAFQRPRSVDFLDALPRNASGKVLKRELREPFWAGQRRRVGGA